MVACAFHAAWFEMTEIFGMPIPLTVCTLGDVTCVLRRFEADFALLQIFHLKYLFVVRGRLEVQKEHGKRLISSGVFGIPDISNCMPEFSNFILDVLWIDEILQFYLKLRDRSVLP
jgi:hypothetical protein